MGDEHDNEDKNFNPMNLKRYLNKEECERAGLLELHTLATSEFKQQNMDAWRPIPTLSYSVGIFLAIATICVAFGIPLLGNIMLHTSASSFVSNCGSGATLRRCLHNHWTELHNHY